MEPIKIGNFIIRADKVPSHNLRTAKYRPGDPAISIRNDAEKWTTSPFTSLKAIRQHYRTALTEVEFEGRTFGFAQDEVKGSTYGKEGRRSWVKPAIAYGYEGGPVSTLSGRYGADYLIPITDEQEAADTIMK